MHHYIDDIRHLGLYCCDDLMCYGMRIFNRHGRYNLDMEIHKDMPGGAAGSYLVGSPERLLRFCRSPELRSDIPHAYQQVSLPSPG